jgi:hypothetical protein
MCIVFPLCLLWITALVTFGLVTAGAQPLLPATHYKVRVLREVGDRLARAKGDGLSTPAIEIVGNTGNSQLIAKLRTLPRPVLLVDEKT